MKFHGGVTEQYCIKHFTLYTYNNKTIRKNFLKPIRC